MSAKAHRVNCGSKINLPATWTDDDTIFVTEEGVYKSTGDGLPLERISDIVYSSTIPENPTNGKLYVIGIDPNFTLQYRFGNAWYLITGGDGKIASTVRADIAARDAISGTDLFEGLRCHVVDASADSTVESGAAGYIYDGSSWIKTYEGESLDIELNWGDIIGGPASTPAEIDDAVTKKHEHSNKSVIDKFSEDAGVPQFDGDPIKLDIGYEYFDVFNLNDYRTDEAYIGDESEPESYAGVNIIGYLPVSSGLNTKIRHTGSGNVSQKVWIFDENKTLLAIVGNSSGATASELFINGAYLENAAYIGFITFGGSIPDYHLYCEVIQTTAPEVSLDTIYSNAFETARTSLYRFNTHLNFKGFAGINTQFPSYPALNDVYLIRENGAILGVNVLPSDLGKNVLRYNGNTFELYAIDPAVRNSYMIDVFNLDDYRTDETYIGAESAPESYAGINVVGYLPITPGKEVLIQRTSGGNLTQKVWCFGADKSLVSILGDSSAATENAIQIPPLYLANVYYIGFITYAAAIPDCSQDCQVLQMEETTLGEETIHRFSVSVNTVNPLIVPSNAMTAAQDSEQSEIDHGVLMLPKNYASTGTPIKLVIGCHGGGGTVTASGSQTESYNIYKYLVANGYAVMDMAGMPAAYSARNVIDQNRVMGCYFAAMSYQKGYEHIIKNYNIDTNGVFLNGGSNGGLTSHAILEHTNIPVLAMSGIAPLLSMGQNAWTLTSASISGGWATAYGNRLNIIKLYGMTDPVVYEADGVTIDVAASQANLNAATFEAAKVIGFDPYTDGVWDDSGTKKKKLKVPYKVWQAVDDTAITPAITEAYIDMLKAGGSFAVYRELASGGHSPEDAGSVIGSFVYNGTTYDLHPVEAELLMWFHRFNKNK